MKMALTKELERAVKRKMESGMYRNASEVICEALRIAMKHEHGNVWLAREAAVGFAQLEAGAVTRVTSKEEFIDVICGKSGE